MANHNITLTATDKTRGTLQNVDKNLDRVTRRSLMFKGALGLAAGAIAALGAVKVFGGVIQGMDDLAKSARNVGVTTEREFAKFQVIKKFTEEAGISTSEFDRSMRNLQTRMEQGLNGNKTYAAIMDKLGTSIFDANGNLKSTPDLFTAVGTAMQDGTINLSDAQKLLGEMVGPKIFQSIQQLTDDGVGLGEALAEVAGSMNIIALEDANQAEAFGDALARVKDALYAVLVEAITPLLPGMTRFLEDLAAKAPEYLGMFSNALATLQPYIDTLWNVLQEYIIPFLGQMFDNFLKLTEIVKPFAEAVMPLVVAAFDLFVVAAETLLSFIAPLAEQALPAFQTAVEFLIGVVETITTKLTEWGSKMDEITTTVLDFKDRTVGVFKDLGSSVVDQTNSMTKGIKDAWYNTWDYLVGNSIIPDMKEDIISEFKDLDKGVTLTTKQTVDGVMSDYDKLAQVLEGKTSEMAESVKTNMEKATDYIGDFNKNFNDTLVDGLVDGNLSFDTFAGLWKDTLKDLLKDTLNGGNMLSDIMSGIFGGGGGAGGGGGFLSGLFGGGGGGGGGGGFLSGLFGGGGGLGGMFSGISDWFGGMFSGISSFFGGFFADGGHLPAGKFGIAGEAGPEIITGPARVISNEDSFGGGAAPTVNITITAVDTQTGTEFLLNNKKQIEGIIQNAYNRRGKQGIY